MQNYSRENLWDESTVPTISDDLSNKAANSFSKSELEKCSKGQLFGIGNAQLPSAPLLMLDRILDIQSEGGEFGRGYAVAEFDISPESWFFVHHFEGDPIMPGSLLVEAMWQLAGFHLAWSGHSGKGRVLDGGRTRFAEPIYSAEQSLLITIQINKIVLNPRPINIANGTIAIDGEIKCRCNAVKVALL